MSFSFLNYRLTAYSLNRPLLASRFRQIRCILPRSRYLTVKSASSLSCQANSLESTTNPSRLSKRCSKPALLFSRSRIWNLGGASPSKGNWNYPGQIEKFLVGGSARFGMRAGCSCCILRFWESKVGDDTSLMRCKI
jgi:hypothetical protein